MDTLGFEIEDYLSLLIFRRSSPLWKRTTIVVLAQFPPQKVQQAMIYLNNFLFSDTHTFKKTSM